MSESIVSSEKPVQSHINPFAKNLPDHVSAGAVAIESERAIAEAQGKLVIAKRFPRDQARAYSSIIDACKRPGLAEEACYSFPRGGQTVSGPSIRLAEMLAANWGNIDYGIRELSRKEGVSEMEAYCWDLETNTMSSQKFTVRHIRDTRGGGVKLTDERDIYELTANMGGRRLRARILAILPADLVQAAVDECGKTLAGSNDLPVADRIRQMVTAFKVLGVDPVLIEKRLGHALTQITPDELGDLRKIHNSIRDGVSKVGDWFGDGPKEDADGIEGDPVVARAEPPKRKAKGAAAVTESPAAIVPPVVEQKSVEVAKVVEATPEPAAVSEPRAFLKDKEEIVANVEVLEASGINITKDGQLMPSVALKLKGDFVGQAYHIGGGVKDGDAVKPGEPWAVGAVVKAKLFGKLNNKAGGKVQVFVASVESAGEPAMEV